MNWRARILLALAMLMTPAYVLLDRVRVVPLALRDRPWPFVIVAALLALIAWRVSARAWWLALVVALVSPAAIGWAAYVRYRLPPASASAGVGAPLPDVELPDEQGQLIKLRALTGKPLVLIWFRGSWCPYCRRQLSELQTELARYADVRLIAVAPDPPEPLAKMKREMNLQFSLLADPDRKLVGACEVGHCVAVVDTTGIVRWGVISGNWEKDLPARALLQMAYRERARE